MAALHKALSVQLTTPEGISIDVPVPLEEMSEAEKAAFGKFNLHKTKALLTPEEAKLLEDRKVFLKADGVHAALICRMDWSCWSIN